MPQPRLVVIGTGVAKSYGAKSYGGLGSLLPRTRGAVANGLALHAASV